MDSVSAVLPGGASGPAPAVDADGPVPQDGLWGDAFSMVATRPKVHEHLQEMHLSLIHI